MEAFPNVMAIFKLLEKSNCRQCNEATCLAFAAAVFKAAENLRSARAWTRPLWPDIRPAK
jgi:ArsR family metal-binding transcriptional regulator